MNRLYEVLMAKDTSSAFLGALADHLANNKRFVDQVVATVVARMMASKTASTIAAPAKRGPGRPRKVPAAAAPAPAPAKRGRPKKGGRRGDASDLVLAAIRAGASTRSTIRKKAGVTIGGYGYAIKTLKARGLVKVQGTRGQAKVIAV
jgi:hypothetical protein